jgi:hypothetical protein
VNDCTHGCSASREMARRESAPSESCRYRRLIASAVELYSMSRISYGLRNKKNQSFVWQKETANMKQVVLEFESL